MNPDSTTTAQGTAAATSPLLKFALELGPLVVFFLANSYGNQLAEAFPVLKALGGKIFIGTAFLMVAMVVSRPCPCG
ncbi:MAG: hypothetical protein R3D29_06255 [Nitratireductor sp.]